MKIVYFANIRIPTEKAHGVQIMKMCEAFAFAGNEVKLIVPNRLNDIKEDPFEYYGVKRNFKIVKLPCIDFVFFDLGGWWAFVIQSATFLFSAKIFLFFHKYDVLYTRSYSLGFFFKGFILEAHTFPKKVGFYYRKLWGKTKAFVVLTSFLKKKMIDLGIDEKKILVSPDGVDLSEFEVGLSKEELRKELLLPEKQQLVGYVGMLHTMGVEKGVSDAIKSLAYLDKNVLLVFVGGNAKDVDFYKRQAEKEGFGDRIIFTGKVKRKIVPMYLKAFDVLIAPFPDNEHYRFYMSPLKIFEYMASGSPIVVSDLPSIREILNEKNSVLVEPGNFEELSSGIKKVFNGQVFSVKVAEQAFLDVKDYTWQKRVERIIAFVFKVDKELDFKKKKQ